MSNKLQLKSVTLVIVDTQNIHGALVSIQKSQSKCVFYETLVFTNSDFLGITRNYSGLQDTKYHCVRISSVSEYSLFMLKDLKNFVKTPFVLITQWDSWVINTQGWNDSFFRYDYNGAVWPHHTENRVGNGGFSLRSQRLLEATSELCRTTSFLEPIVEDDLICRQHRTLLERKGVKFASEEAAGRFSTEREGLISETFGFHGFFNFGSVMEKSKLKEYLEVAPLALFHGRASYDLCLNLIKSGQLENAALTLRKRVYAIGVDTKGIRLVLLLMLLGPIFFLASKLKNI